MRQLSPLTNLLLACAAAAGLALSIGLPWYAASQAVNDADAGAIGDVQGPLETAAADAFDVFAGTEATVTGAELLTTGQSVLLVLGGLTAVFGLAFFAGIFRGLTRELLRIVPLAAPVAVAYHLVDHPAPGLELRWGLLASLAIAGFMASSAWHASTRPAPKPRPAPYVPPAPPAGSMPPPAA